MAESVSVRDSAGVAIATILRGPEALPKWKLGEVTLRIDGYGSGVGPYFDDLTHALWLSDGRILIADEDTRQLHLYDPTGLYLMTFGGEGEGPEEFQRVGSVTVGSGDTVYVFDPRLGSIKLFHPSRGFLRSVRMVLAQNTGHLMAVWPWQGNRFVGYWLRREETRPDTIVGKKVLRSGRVAVLSLVDETGGLAAEPMEFSGGYTSLVDVGEVRMPFAERPIISVDRSGILYGSGEALQLTKLDSLFQPELRIEWPSAGEESISEREIEQLQQILFGGTLTPFEQRLAEVMFASETLPDVRPALGRVLVDAEGRIWAGRFEPPFVRHETLWYVLNSDGEPIARLEIPKERRAYVTAVKRDDVLLITRDAVDVSSVEVVRLVRE